MGNDTQSTTSWKRQPEQDHLDRRQFFNGLGKWSIAIIAAVSGLRDSPHEVQSGIGSRFEKSTGGLGDPRQRIAKKKRPHGDQPHIDNAHGDGPINPHQDYWRAID